MSISETTRTKSYTESSQSQSTVNPLFSDRWSHNISYRQLVISSCISIVQLWWHPYIHDLRKLLPFIFIYNVFSIIVGYPMFYLELALGVVTKKGVLNCWDLSPLARGIGFAMLSTCVCTALALSVVGAWCLTLLVHSAHSFLPWLHCAAAASPACAARHRPLVVGSETPAQSFFFNYVLRLKRDGLEGGSGTVVRELTFYFVLSWLLIYLIAVKRIYSYSKVVLFKDVLAYFVITCCVLGAFRLKGSSKVFTDCEWSVLWEDVQFWREAIEYSLIEMTVAQGSLVMLGAYCPKQQHGLARTSLFAFLVSKSSSVAAALSLGAVNGALQHDYENSTDIWKGPSSAMVLWADYVTRVPGSQFWSALVFFTLFVLTLSTVALQVQTVMSTFTARSIRKITWIFHFIICLLFCLIGVMTLCTQGGLYILSTLMSWPVLMPRLAIAATVSLVVTYIYGQTTFCEDVYFAVEEYPCVFIRICWALAPGLLLSIFLAGIGMPPSDSTVGWVLVVIVILPIFIFMVIYLVFKCRVRVIKTRKRRAKNCLPFRRVFKRKNILATEK